MKSALLTASFIATLAGFVVSPNSFAQLTEKQTVAAWQSLGGPKFENWSGLKLDGQNQAELTVPASVTYRVPDGGKGWSRPTDLGLEYDGVIDARPWYGLRFDVELDRDDAPFVADFRIRIPTGQERHDILDSSSARVHTQGKGWHTVTVPFASFDYNRGQVKFFKYLKEITLQGSYESGEGGVVKLRNIKLVKGPVLYLNSAIRSKPAEAGATVEYPISVTNCADSAQTVSLALERSGWEGMPAEVAPASLSLPPGESKMATVRVKVPAKLPAGAHETQSLVARPEGGDAQPETLKLMTIKRVPFPFLVHDAPGWEEVRAKVDKYSWAKQQADEIIRKAEDWQVPEPYPNNRAPDGTRAVFKSYIEGELFRCVLAWRLTGEKKYVEKAALFLRRLSNPENGYPKTLHANSQGIPQEGGFFEGCAVAYEAAVEAGVLSEDDQRQIEQTLRLYVGVVKDWMGDGGISNWSVFNLCPAALCALVVQDMALFDDVMDGPCGLVDQLRYGMMDDGWWYEMSLAYNLGCAEAMTQLGLATRAFGIDLLNQKFPAALTTKVGLRPFEFENFEGMAFGKYGPLQKNTATLKQMWDGIAVYPDYRGVMFGMGDGHEHTVGGGPFELAYYAYGDPAYATIIKQGGKRDLVYGVPELPAETPQLYKRSGFSDNAGIAVLRSQTAGREPREQIQAALKYGTHGSYHGHFDRISFLSLMRYGRSFYNPETSWFGYGSYMYKWWVQPSLAHNMVVVDAKQQEPQECRQLLFHSGKMLQAIGAETNARWSNPPYFGGYDQLEKVKSGDAPWVQVPEQHPKPGEVTDYTEPVRQRRVMIVTDDYVILADALKAEHEHTFDNLLHLRGARLADPAKAKLLGHATGFDTNPLGSGQFITNVDRYTATTPAVITSIHRVGVRKRMEDGLADDGQNWETGGAKSLSEPGVLHLDEHVLWPPNAEIAIGDYAETWSVNKKLSYEVTGDGKPLASGTFGAWILGSGKVDVDVTGLKSLLLSARCNRGDKTLKTLFWGDARIVTREGREIPLSELTRPQDSVLKVVMVNTALPPTANRDYEGGPLRIAGQPLTTAVPAEPLDAKEPATVRVDLSGLEAVRFKATVGGDWPVGNEEQLRKVCSVRAKGREAQFLTLIEPYENRAMVKSAVASEPDKLRVELENGAVQEITIHNLQGSGDDIQISMTETKAGQLVRQETTAPTAR